MDFPSQFPEFFIKHCHFNHSSFDIARGYGTAVSGQLHLGALRPWRLRASSHSHEGAGVVDVVHPGATWTTHKRTGWWGLEHHLVGGTWNV